MSLFAFIKLGFLFVKNHSLFYHSKIALKSPGDQHWGELLAKKMPESEEFGAEQVSFWKEIFI